MGPTSRRARRRTRARAGRRAGGVDRRRHVGRRLRPARRARRARRATRSRIETHARSRTATWSSGSASVGSTSSTGLQLLAFNTIFQLAAHDPAPLARAAHVVMLPELVVSHLTGEVVAETTSAGSTGLLDLADRRLVTTSSATPSRSPAALLPEILPAGTRCRLVAGRPRAPRRWPRHRVGRARRSADPTRRFVSAGTWLLVGREQALPDTSRGGADRGVHERAGRHGRHPIPPERRGLVVGRGVPPRRGR